MKLNQKFKNLKDRLHDKIKGGKSRSGSPSVSNRASADSASGARGSGQEIHAEQTAQIDPGGNATLNQNPTASSRLDVLTASSASAMASSARIEGHGSNTAGTRALTPTPASDSVHPVSTPGGGHEDDMGGSLISPDADPADPQGQGSDLKSKAKDVLGLAWTAVQMLLKRVEPFLDGTPAKGPVAAANALIELKDAVGDNKNAIEEFIIQITDRLLVVNGAMDQDAPNSPKPQTVDFVRSLRTAIKELQGLAGKGAFRRVLENEDDKKAIEASFKRIDAATKTFQLGVAVAMDRKVDDIRLEIKLEKLYQFRARKAIYDADLGSGVTVTREACTNGTREDILADIIKWAEDTSVESPSVFWLTGNAGSGKTTIAYTIAEYFENLESSGNTGHHAILGASFHCSRQFEETRRQIHIVPTIAYELARKSHSYRHALHEADKFDSVDRLNKQIKDLIADPWEKSTSARHSELPPYLVIVDALDEIEAGGGSKFLHGMLETIGKLRLQGLKFLFTSRPDPSVTKQFDQFSHKTLYKLQDVPVEHVANDIGKFLQNKLPRFQDREELGKMVQLADGLFISAATIVRYLTPSESITMVEQYKLFKKLYDKQSSGGLLIDQLYQQILYDAFSKFDDDTLFNSRLLILHTFLCTIERTSADVTAALLSQFDLDVNIEVVNAVLETLYAVLHYKNGQVLWYHASFPDFIFDKTRSTFKFGFEGSRQHFSMTCNLAEHYAHLTKSCFKIMEHSLHFNMGAIPSSFLLDTEDPQLAERVEANIDMPLRYACKYWSSHLCEANQENEEDFSFCIDKFLEISVLFWIETMNLVGYSNHCSAMLQSTRRWVLKNTREKTKLAANLAEAASFATYFRGNPPALSTPHLYISALATWSTGSEMSQQWKKKFPDIPLFIDRRASSNALLMKIQTRTEIQCAAFSHDGTHIVSGSHDKSVRVWVASTGAELKILKGHTQPVNSVAFSPDGTHIVSGSGDKSVRVWDASTGAELKVLEGHTDSVNSVAFSPDGTHIVSGSNGMPVGLHNAAFIAGAQVSATELASESDKLSTFLDQAYPAWTTASDQWMYSEYGEYRLMWAPDKIYPFTVLVISQQGFMSVSFYNCKIGPHWECCYASD